MDPWRNDDLFRFTLLEQPPPCASGKVSFSSSSSFHLFIAPSWCASTRETDKIRTRSSCYSDRTKGLPRVFRVFLIAPRLKSKRNLFFLFFSLVKGRNKKTPLTFDKRRVENRGLVFPFRFRRTCSLAALDKCCGVRISRRRRREIDTPSSRRNEAAGSWHSIWTKNEACASYARVVYTFWFGDCQEEVQSWPLQ